MAEKAEKPASSNASFRGDFSRGPRGRHPGGPIQPVSISAKERCASRSADAIPTRADDLFGQVQAVLAGGVSASMRLHPYLGRPFYVDRGEGPYLYHLDGRRYIDFNTSNGAARRGHGCPPVRRAVQRGLEAGGVPAVETFFHDQLAAVLVEIIPAAERVCFAQPPRRSATVGGTGRGNLSFGVLSACFGGLTITPASSTSPVEDGRG